MRWTRLARLTLTSTWQFVLIPTGSFIRVIHSSVPNNPTAWICQAERLADNTYQICNQQSLRPQGGVLTEVFKLEKPEFFNTNYVGVRQKFRDGGLGWEVEIQEGDLQAVATPEPETLFTYQVPAQVNQADNTAYSLGLKFQTTVDGYLKGIRFWKDSNESGTHVGKIWAINGTLLRAVDFTNETSSAWQNQLFPQQLFINANTTYLVSVNCNTSYVYTIDEFNNAVVNQNLIGIVDGNNGVYGQENAMPTNSFRNTNYFRDVIFIPI